MLTKERARVRATVSLRVLECEAAGDDCLFQARRNGAEGGEFCSPLFEFAGNAPATFAERFPRLTVGAVAVALVLATITAEIECLRGAGYYWQ
jgi:hypothetical protein